MQRIILTLMLIFCLDIIPLSYAGTIDRDQYGSLTISPEVMHIGTFYSGGEITISGEMPGGQDIFIEVIGPIKSGLFDIKGRVGPFWMTTDKAELDGAPSMYALLLPGGEKEWLPAASSLGLGLDQLKDKITIQSTAMQKDNIFDMFLDLKKDEGLYIENDNAVIYASSQNNRRAFTATYLFPPSTVAGEYTIKVTAVENGAKRSEQYSQFSVEETGFTRLVDDLATNRRVLYGTLAVLIALFAGAITGVLFKGGGGH